MRTRRSQSSNGPVPADGHQSVLLHEVIAGLAIEPSDIVVDATVGGGGHTKAFAEILDENGTLIGIDADAAALERAREALQGTAATVHLVQGNFRNIAEISGNLASPGEEKSISRLDRVLFDLGWSSYQLAAGRGFSFQSNEPLLMTYGDPEQALLTARDIVNTWEEEHIADVLYGWGEERFARRIARAIVQQRNEQPIETAKELAECIHTAVPGWYRGKKIHPATKTFQALRIAVNDEMGTITEGLAGVRTLLAPGGRVAVITFHSVEDRLVKRTFRAWKEDGYGTPVTKKPITATREEIQQNPRARSAKLRIFERSH